MKKPMKNLSLPISMDDVLRGKSVEWERRHQMTEVRRQRSAVFAKASPSQGGQRSEDGDQRAEFFCDFCAFLWLT
jgi:hypothetical protein